GAIRKRAHPTRYSPRQAILSRRIASCIGLECGAVRAGSVGGLCVIHVGRGWGGLRRRGGARRRAEVRWAHRRGRDRGRRLWGGRGVRREAARWVRRRGRVTGGGAFSAGTVFFGERSGRELALLPSPSC